MEDESILQQIYVVDDVLSPSHLKMLVDTVKSRTFNWSFLDNTHTDAIDSNYLNAFGFVHDLYDYKVKQIADEHWGTFTAPLLSMVDKCGFEFHSLLRARVNMTVKTGGSHHGYPHIDDNEMHNMFSAIFYLEDSDGDTCFYDNPRRAYAEKQTPVKPFKLIRRVSPKANSGVIFNANIFHGGMLPTENQTRRLVNYNFTGVKK